MSIEARVCAIVAAQFRTNEGEVKAESRFIEDFGADSIDIVDLIVAMEDEFEMEIPNKKVEQMRSVGDAISFFKEHQ